MSARDGMTDEDLELLELTRGFAAGEVTPNAAEWDAAQALPDAFLESLAEMGFFGMPIGEEQGGLGLGAPVYHEVLAVLAEADPSVALTVAEHGAVAFAIERFAPAELAGSLLPELAAGERIGTSALLEAGTDPDPETFETTSSGDAVTGRKRAVVHASRASVFLVGAAGGDGPVLELVDGTDGLEVGDRTTTMGLSATEFADLHLEGTPVATRLGGAEALAGLSSRLHTGMAAVALGIARGALAHAVRYSEERSQFGSSLSGFDAIQAKLAEVATRCWAAESALADVSRTLGRENGTPVTDLDARTASVKILASECAMFAADEAVQIFGGYGYMRDYPVEKQMRDAKGTEVLGGTNEALKRILARRLLSAARSS